MTGTSYVPGTWLGIVRGSTAVILGPDSPPALPGAVWELLGTNPEVHEILHAVTSSSGGSLAQIPSFGILEATGPLRVFLRGDLDLAVELPDGRVELDGRDVTTWNERRFALPGSCRLAIPAAGPAGQQELPLGEGVVLLQSLALVLAPRQPELGPSGAAPASVVVDSAGIADVRDAAPGADSSAEMTGVPERGASAEMTIVPDHEAAVETVAPEHGASAETVAGVVDDDVLADDGDHEDQDGDLEQEDGNAHVAVTGAGPDSGADSGPDDASSVGSAPAEILPSGVRPAQAHPAEPAPGEPVLPAGPATPASDHTSSYDHLWERTVVRSIEDAAVRDDADAEIDGTPEAGPEVEEQAEPPVPGQPDGQERPTPATTPAAGPPAAPPAPPASHEPTLSPVSPAPAGGLIDSVPWKKGGDNAPQIHAPQGSAGSRPAMAAPASAGVLPATAPGGAAPAAAAKQPPAGSAAVDTDHDGQTVMKSSIARSAGQPATPVTEDPAAGPTVLARVCRQGHANPPTRAQCAACGAGLIPDAVQVPRPRLGRVRVSTGELLDLDQSLIIGRQPSVSRVQGGVMPRLVQVPSPEGDISRSHVEVRLEGWHVMLCDLKATNGTVLVREGQSPRRLAQNEMAILLDGDIAELGDNISLRFEEIP